MKSRILFAAPLYLLFVWHTVMASDWLIVPGIRAGPVTKQTNEAKLKLLFGSSQVMNGDIPMGEGETEPGTIIFPNAPEKTLMILWSDNTHSSIREVRINAPKSIWKTDKGITIGTPLSMIEKLNARPVAITGFGWDYGGTITHSDGGKLTELGHLTPIAGLTDRTLLLRADPGAELYSTREYESVQGEGEFKSDHPSMRKLNPKVYEMIITFN